MNPSLTYQIYQAERTTTRAEILASDARRGHLAASFAETRRLLTGRLSRRLTQRTDAIRTITNLGVAAGDSAH